MKASKPMTSETEILSEADEIAALLPWYVSGKISAADKARVDTYTKAHPDVLRHIALAREEADSVFADNSAIQAPRDGLARLQKSLAASPRAKLHAVQASVIDRFGQWLVSLAPRQLAYAGMAAAALLVMQAATIGSRITQPGGSYSTASGDKPSTAQGAFALVAFQPAAPLSTVSAFLADSGFAIVDGPKSGGMYRVRLADKALAQTDLDAAIAKLKARGDLIAFASAASSTP
jgi:anti-sigma factor RsiW